MASKTVVVGIRLDSQSREILTWALVKAASAGDRVVALHVLSGRCGGMEFGADPVALLSLAKEFDDMLSVYEGFCNLKQIDLKLKICKGPSIRKVLVLESKEFGAAKLILGVASNNSSIVSSTVSVAKYCAKKLPGNCSVFALKNGKIVFKREAAGLKRSSREVGKVVADEDGNELYCILPGRNGNDVGLEPSRSSRKSDEVVVDKADNELYCVLPGRDGNGVGLEPSRSSKELCEVVNDGEGNELYCVLPGRNDNDVGLEPSSLRNDEINDSSKLATDAKGQSVVDASPRKSCLMCTPDIQLPSSNELTDEGLLASIEMEKSEVPLSSPVSARTDRPSLRRLVLTTKKIDSSDKHKSSLIKWPVRTPNRFSSVKPAHKSVKSDGNQMGNQNCDSGTVVHVETDLSRSPFVDDDLEWKLSEELESLREKYSSTCRVFSCNELIEAISNFSTDMLIGVGGSSRVYKGRLPEGKELAVKVLKASKTKVEEFVSEIEILTTLQHRNIISLGGFCIDKSNLMLVYNYLSRGSLEEILHGDEGTKHVLSWSKRYKVAVGVAEALGYLHGGGGTEPVIHRDVKSSNILLSDDLEPQLSDFGLAKWASKSGSQLTPNDVAGTFGYLAPEYVLYGKVNEKVDVYAFGVVLLELLSGRKPINTGLDGKESIVMWAKPILLAGGLEQLIDPCLGSDYDSSQVDRMVLAASLCTRRHNQARPQISIVLKLLKGDEDVIDWARLEVDTVKPPDCLDEVAIPEDDIQSHLSLALLDVEDDSLSNSSTDCTTGSLSTKTSVEDYLQWRSSRSSSFD